MWKPWPPILLLALATPVWSTPKVTFNRDIAPIIYSQCSVCHRPGESAPFALLSFDDARRHATQIAEVTKRRYMPPWQPEAGYGDFAEQRRLSDSQIQLIQQWVADGELPGPAADAPKPPKFSSEWQLGPPDLVLHVTHPYQLAADGGEVFWNFVLPVPVTAERWVRAIEVRPGNPKVFHHANVIMDRAGTASRLEPKSGYGFEGMDITVQETSFDPDSHFLSWKPGSEPVVSPEGMAWKATPGMNLVLNVHLRPTGKPETVSPEIGIYFTSSPQTKFPMLIQLEHDAAISIAPGETDFVVSDDFTVPVDLHVLAIYPHAHYLSTLMEGYATLPDGTRKWLIRIPHWDLNWQGVYRCSQPVFLPKGSIISQRFHYDNSTGNIRNPSSPPKRVTAGNGSTDEMGHLWLQVLPVADSDQRAIVQEALMKHRLAKYPGDFSADFNLGALMMDQNKPAEAIPYFQEASLAQPSSALAANEMGVAQMAQSNLRDAYQSFQKAVALDPNYTDARFNLASAEAASGDYPNAAGDFRRVITEAPQNEKAKQHLGEVLYLWGDDFAKAGNFPEAASRYREAVTYRPADPELHTNLGQVLFQLGRRQDAVSEFEAALRIDPTFEPARRALTVLQRH
jgi:Flp pilus assembly protein TadD